MNSYLAKFSPLYSLHAENLGLNFFRMSYVIYGLEGTLKERKTTFLRIEKLHVALAWHELMLAKVIVNVDIHEAKMKVTTETIHALSGETKDQAKEDAKNVKDSTVPFDLSRLRIVDSSFDLSDVAGLPPEQDFFLDHMQILVNNLTPKEKDGLSVFTALGDVQGQSKIKVVGEFKVNQTPVDWSTNVELRDFDLTRLNPIARRTVPLTFKSGTLSLYSASQSVDGKVLGYVKPFFKNMVLIGDHGDFKNVGQFFIEIAGTIGNFFLKNSKNHVLATKIEFKTVNGEIETNTSKALKIAIDNAFGEALPQKIDEKLELK